MKPWLIAILACLLSPLCWAQTNNSAGPQQLLIVVSQQSQLQQISAAELRDVYFGVLTKRDELRSLQPIDATPSAERDFFYQFLVGRSRNQMQAYWSRVRFTGRGEPPPSMDLVAIVSYLQQHPNSIAYLPVSMRDSLANMPLRQVLVIP